MKHYVLRLKTNDGDIVDRILSESLKEAMEIYVARKQMNEETFNKLYEVTEDDEK